MCVYSLVCVCVCVCACLCVCVCEPVGGLCVCVLEVSFSSPVAFEWVTTMI